MTIKEVLDLKLLQSSAVSGQAIHLRSVYNGDPTAASSITPQLISLVASDVLPPIVLTVWPSVANDPHAILAVIRQELCLSAQRAAIKSFCRHLYREKTFAKAWEAAGGVTGVAQLAAKLNVNGVRYFFNLLGATGRAQGARKERQRAMEDLLKFLWGLDGDEHAAIDSRPLREEYVKILPACGGAFRLEWAKMDRELPKRYNMAVATDHEFFEQHYEEELRRNKIDVSEFLEGVKPLVIHRTEYGLHILDKFVESENLLGASPDAFLETVIHPLGKRFLSEKRIDSDTTMRFWSRVVMCLKERQAFRKDFPNSSTHYIQILNRLVKVWNNSRARAEYTEMLTVFFSLIPKAAMTGYSMLDVVSGVAKARKYQLLRLFLKETAGFQFDIGEPASLEHSGLENYLIPWQTQLFFALSADEAFPLWEKVQRAGKDVVSRRSPTYVKALYDCRNPEQLQLVDPSIMRALLLNQSQAKSPFSAADLDTMRSELHQEVSRRMKKAAQGRVPEDRAHWAVSALSLCVAIGDLELYAGTLLWARRFNKDPLAVKELYSGNALNMKEVSDLLAVLPAERNTLTVSVEELSRRIHSANEILQNLLDTAIMGTNEPSFSAWDWNHVFDLISRAICSRIDGVNDFQDRTKLSDDVLYQAVWQPTSALLKKLLPNILGPPNEMFGGRGYSTLSCIKVNKPETLREPTIKFLDHLAEFYDSMWTELRLRETPALVTADEIWPKGLTLQHLTYYFGPALHYMPYARPRIEAVVFMNPLKVLQPVQVDEETQLAIGTFIDSWAAALQLYIQMPGQLAKEEQRKERISRAWWQATVNLSKGRMSPEEAERFWWPVFEDVGVKKNEVGINEKEDERPDPFLPDADEDMQPIEWNPDPEYDRISQPDKSRTLTPTCLDVLLSRSRFEPLYKFTKAQNSALERVKCVIPGKPRPGSFWDELYSRRLKLTGASADAFGTAGILALNMRKGSDVSMLKTPFPSSEAVRIPAVYLDQEFLEREVEKHTPASIGILQYLKYYLPAGLLAQLAGSVLESIRKKPESAKPHGIFVRIISTILEGAKPSLAIPLIQQFVLENPNASSWHRPLLNTKALIHFLPADAKRFFESFTDAILDKLQEQAERPKQESGDASENKGPLVKVTTVKMLAQLLRESPVVDPSLAVELNIRILKRASHIDIRAAAVKGLAEAMDSTTSPEVKKRILNSLLKYAAPIASSINESQPLMDWDALTAGSELPEVWRDSNWGFTTPPIMDLILGIGQKMDWNTEEGRLYQELIYSVLDSSAENSQRWMKLFTNKHGFSVPDDAQLPAIPMFPTALNALLRVMKSETPAKYVDMAKQYLMLRINLPDWVSAITDAVRANRKLVSSNSGTQWYYLWNSDFDMLTQTLFSTICVHLQADEDEDEEMGDVEMGVEEMEDEKMDIEEAQPLESFLFEVADCILMQGNLSRFQAFLNVTSDISREHPVWGRILERINGLRTPAWQADPNRKPAVLPDTLPLRIRMLNLSTSPKPWRVQEVATRCASGVVKLLNDLVSSGVPYYKSFDTLHRELMNNAEPKVLMAIMIGSVPALDDAKSVTLVDHLRVELAVAMLDRSYIFRKGNSKPDIPQQAGKRRELGWYKKFTDQVNLEVYETTRPSTLRRRRRNRNSSSHNHGSLPNEEDILELAKELVMKLSDSSVENFRTLATPMKSSIENTSDFDLWS
ncbi:hypothetical protein V8C42DRAFT_355121 [Trichoderma barbatum]